MNTEDLTTLSFVCYVFSFFRFRFGTDIRYQWRVSRLLAKNKFEHFQCTRIQPITLSAYSFVVKKTNSENEVIKNKGGKKRNYKGYVDRKEKSRIKYLGCADVWRNITVAQLAQAMKIELGMLTPIRMLFLAPKN